jgi:signal peptidase I
MTMEAVWEHPVRVRRLAATMSGREVRLAAWAVFVTVVVAWALFFRAQALGGPATYLIVSGRSMEPALHAGDLVVASRQRTYRQGDVIAYHIPQNQAGAGALVIHRIVGGSPRDGYVTRGDNRSYRDPWRPRRGDIAGKMRLHAPRLGLLPVFAHTTAGMALIAALVGFFVLRGGTNTGVGGGQATRLRMPRAHLLRRSSLKVSGGRLRPYQSPLRRPPPVQSLRTRPVDHAPSSVSENTGHLRFAWSPAGYQLVGHPGEPPSVGAFLGEHERLYRVSKVACSPLPSDPRPCAYLEPA